MFCLNALAQADIGKAMLSSGPLTTFMDLVSFVETARNRICLKSKGVQLANSMCTTTCDELRQLNWRLLNGDRGYETVAEYSAILEAHPQSELLEPFGLTFSDMFPNVFAAMCDTYRRICLPSEQLKFCILELGQMSTDDAMNFLIDVASRPLCCSGNPFVQATSSTYSSLSTCCLFHVVGLTNFDVLVSHSYYMD